MRLLLKYEITPKNLLHPQKSKKSCIVSTYSNKNNRHSVLRDALYVLPKLITLYCTATIDNVSTIFSISN